MKAQTITLSGLRKRAIPFINSHAKYIILIGIYLTCLLLSTVYDPYAHTWTEYTWGTGEEYEVSTNAEEYFYRDNFGGDLTFKENLSPLTYISARVFTLGAADILNVFTWIGSHDREEITMAVFPILAAIKFFLMKKYFSRKKDPLKRSWRNLLYYSSENFLFDIAADTVVFYLTGVIINAVDRLCNAVVASHGYAFKGASDLLLAVMLIFCFIPYKVTGALVSEYNDFICYHSAFSYYRDTLHDLLLKLLLTLLASFIFLLLFELAMRIMMKPVGIVFETVRRKRKQKKKRQTENANKQASSVPTDGTQIYTATRR